MGLTLVKRAISPLVSLHPERKRLAIVLGNFSPPPHHHDSATRRRHTTDLMRGLHRQLAEPDQAEFAGAACSTLDRTNHTTHEQQGREICRYLAWRSRNPHDRRLHKIGRPGERC